MSFLLISVWQNLRSRGMDRKTLRELKVREKYNINLIGLKHGDKMNMNVAPDEVFPADCTVVAAGANSDLNKVSEN